LILVRLFFPVRSALFISGIFMLVFLNQETRAQDTLSFFEPAKAYNAKRARIVWITATGLYGGSMAFLYSAWYKGYSLGKFHRFNDNKEWQQMDKAGHLFNSYNICRYASDLVLWTGVSRKTATLEAVGASLLCMSSIEVFDGFSNEWGFSMGDMVVNASGAGLYLAQELAWEDQRIRIKYSFFPSKYAKYRSALLGKTLVEQILKDYNAQTDWVSINLSAFAGKDTKIPAWLSIAFGYGAEGMLGAISNPRFNEFRKLNPRFERNRRFFLSPDIELSRIKSKSKFMRSLLKNFSLIKFPLPTIELKSNGKWVLHPIYF
jgi:hypothetical protein